MRDKYYRYNELVDDIKNLRKFLSANKFPNRVTTVLEEIFYLNKYFSLSKISANHVKNIKDKLAQQLPILNRDLSFIQEQTERINMLHQSLAALGLNSNFDISYLIQNIFNVPYLKSVLPNEACEKYFSSVNVKLTQVELNSIMKSLYEMQNNSFEPANDVDNNCNNNNNRETTALSTVKDKDVVEIMSSSSYESDNVNNRQQEKTSFLRNNSPLITLMATNQDIENISDERKDTSKKTTNLYNKRKNEWVNEYDTYNSSNSSSSSDDEYRHCRRITTKKFLRKQSSQGYEKKRSKIDEYNAPNHSSRNSRYNHRSSYQNRGTYYKRYCDTSQHQAYRYRDNDSTASQYKEFSENEDNFDDYQDSQGNRYSVARQTNTYPKNFARRGGITTSQPPQPVQQRRVGFYGGTSFQRQSQEPKISTASQTMERSCCDQSNQKTDEEATRNREKVEKMEDVINIFKSDVKCISTITKLLIMKIPHLEADLVGACKNVITDQMQHFKGTKTLKDIVKNANNARVLQHPEDHSFRSDRMYEFSSPDSAPLIRTFKSNAAEEKTAFKPKLLRSISDPGPDSVPNSSHGLLPEKPLSRKVAIGKWKNWEHVNLN